jgi:hypothetical protein
LNRKTFDLVVLEVAGITLGAFPIIRLWSTKTLAEGNPGPVYTVARFLKAALG